MAVQNSLQKQAEQKEQGVVYEVNGMQVKLTPDLVRNYLVSGDKDRVTFQEVAMFMNLCKFSKLNPWLKEAYCIKYGNEPATMVTGKEAFEKRAEDHPGYDGDESGIIVLDESGVITYRNGTLKLPGEEIIGGYAEVWRKDRGHSTRIEVSFDEYAGRKKDGTLNSQWAKKPATMIRKVALVQALREAFPKSFGGMYSAEEQGVVESDFNIVESVVMQEQKTIEHQDNKPEPPQESETPQDVQMALFGEQRMQKIVIPITPVTKKNHQQIVRVKDKYSGKEKVKVIPSKQYKQYEKDCRSFLKPWGIDYPVNVKALYYMPTRRKVDLCNLHEALCDVLVAYGVVVDDNSSIIVSMDGSRVLYDKENPRTEVYIERVETPNRTQILYS